MLQKTPNGPRCCRPVVQTTLFFLPSHFCLNINKSLEPIKGKRGYEDNKKYKIQCICKYEVYMIFSNGATGKFPPPLLLMTTSYFPSILCHHLFPLCKNATEMPMKQGNTTKGMAILASQILQEAKDFPN